MDVNQSSAPTQGTTYNVQCILRVYCTSYNEQRIVFVVYYSLFSEQCMYVPYNIVYIDVHCILYSDTVHRTLQ